MTVIKTNGKRNRQAGHSLERDIVNKLKFIGFPHVCTSRSESKRRDDAKVDIMNHDEYVNGRLPYNIQAKNTNSILNYHGLLGEMPIEPQLNVIIHNFTKKSEGGKFVTKGQFAIMHAEDFFGMLQRIKNLESREKGEN